MNTATSKLSVSSENYYTVTLAQLERHETVNRRSEHFSPRVKGSIHIRLIHTVMATASFFKHFPMLLPSHYEHFNWSPWYPFLGGLSLHLNHLIASCMANYDWPFGTLPFGLFGSYLDTRDLETYPRTYSGHFWNMSIFDDSRAIWVLFRKWVVSEN